ncbi:hypothetical protein [Tellurirhabdus bombi]|uniref:hypothetical protein n=1 Tax=Tellurirhabdus bombi TaxID=2907205 RepID=UPI001F2D109C|nr:hypothetical protein [Tellurirhabdus bombi]
MAKHISELAPADKVMVKLGSKSQNDPESGEQVVVEKEKTIEVTYAYFQSVTQASAEADKRHEYNEKSGYSRVLGRTIKLLGTAKYSDVTGLTGETIQVPSVEKFSTKKPAATDTGGGENGGEGGGDGEGGEN